MVDGSSKLKELYKSKVHFDLDFKGTPGALEYISIQGPVRTGSMVSSEPAKF